MRRPKAVIPWAIGVCGLLFSAERVLSETGPAAVAPRYAVERTRQAQETPARRAELPDSLRPGFRAGRADRATVTRPLRSIEVAAQRAASWAIDDRLRGVASRGYLQLGFFDGLRDVLRAGDPHLRDRQQGQRLGLRDLEAQALGLELGNSDAARLARERSAGRVEAQFRNLTQEPRFEPRAVTPAYRPPAFELPDPNLRAIIREFSLGDPRLPRSLGHAFAIELGVQAERLHTARDHAAFYDASWTDARLALAAWRSDPVRARAYRRFSHERDRVAFVEAFEAAFDRLLPVRAHRILERSYARGFDQGWLYGAIVDAEFAFRRGYNAGFRQAAAEAARAGFRRAYPKRYASAYADVFDVWSANPHLEIGSLRLSDGNDDGVFEPGEAVRLHYSLVNYGGRGGSFEATLNGAIRGLGPAPPARLGRRTATEMAPLTAVVDPDAAPRTTSYVELEIDGVHRRVPLRISYPLELPRAALTTVREDLQGRLVAEVRIRNTSRRGARGQLAVWIAGRRQSVQRQSFGPVGPGDIAVCRFTLDGLDPLDLIAGQVAVGAEVQREAGIDDRFVYRLAGTARDLENGDLMMMLGRLAHDASAAPERIDLARRLLLERLRADWSAAAAGRGNPYKRDYRHGTASTALGELVRVWQQQRRFDAGDDLYRGLSDEVVDLADELPGLHPLLRKYVRRLASNLP